MQNILRNSDTRTRVQLRIDRQATNIQVVQNGQTYNYNLYAGNFHTVSAFQWLISVLVHYILALMCGVFLMSHCILVLFTPEYLLVANCTLRSEYDAW